MSELILASTSPARRALMTSLGLPFRAEAPGVDEHVATTVSVEDMVLQLAERKARAVLARFPNALIIGSDQLVSLDGHALGKPADAVAARAQLASLRGRTHEILTAVCVVSREFFALEVDVAKLSVWSLTDDELDGYVATNEWQGCAGGYRVEARGQALFERIDGDRTSIQGLPMLRLTRMLRGAGVRLFA
ncbi:MAG: septum formation protein Maf [Archangium gephyra]|uniref:Nucleoside triphosphate pyrophosphatase n=1 Tax=Archangium gephyra TaxID=48 RepID=A0A2W5V5I5_9BACT|nr:MAG: septum formation protein Maf [Archangium gephyra]